MLSSAGRLLLRRSGIGLRLGHVLKRVNLLLQSAIRRVQRCEFAGAQFSSVALEFKDALLKTHTLARNGLSPLRCFGCCGFGCCGGILLGLGGVLKRKDAVKDGPVAFIQGVALKLAQGCCVTLGLQQSLFKGGALARNGGSSLGRLLDDALSLLRSLGGIGCGLLLILQRVDALLDGPVGRIERVKLALAQRRCVALQLQQALFKPQALICDGCGGLRSSSGLGGEFLLCFGGILQRIDALLQGSIARVQSGQFKLTECRRVALRLQYLLLQSAALAGHGFDALSRFFLRCRRGFKGCDLLLQGFVVIVAGSDQGLVRVGHASAQR